MFEASIYRLTLIALEKKNALNREHSRSSLLFNEPKK